jgi:transposase InsO family protein
MTTDQAKQIALWRYQIIAPLLYVEGPRGSLRKEMRRLAERTHAHPFQGELRIGFGTIENWLYQYKREGFEGLLPKARRDKGTSRRIDAELSERIVALARSRTELDGPGLLAELACAVTDPQQLPSLSTLYRFLRAQGLDQRRGPVRRDHRAFAFELAGDCWQADMMYGPALPVAQGTRRKTYLIAILDDASRLVAHAQFYFEQHLRTLKDCLKQALQKRGLPCRLYLDNARIFRSRQILQLAARLGIQILHTRPYRPQGRAKLERLFGRLRRSFLTRVDVDRLADLDALNRLLWAWIEGDYHVSPHRGLDGETPLDRWVRLSEGIRPLPADVDLEMLFLEHTTRRVAKDGTFTLHGKVFEAGPVWIGRRVGIRFDRFDLRRVMLLDERDQQHECFPVDQFANRHVRRLPDPEPDAPTKRPPLQSLEQLARRIERDRSPQEEPDED